MAQICSHTSAQKQEITLAMTMEAYQAVHHWPRCVLQSQPIHLAAIQHTIRQTLIMTFCLLPLSHVYNLLEFDVVIITVSFEIFETDATSTQQAPEAGATLSLFSFSVAQATIFVSLEDHCCHYSPSWYFLTAMHHGTYAPSG
eukprot:scaffold11052_cov83-Skeletonema_dohrnii-CCMP3373.AAC.2